MHPDHCRIKQLDQDKQFAQTESGKIRSFKSSDPVYVRSYGTSSELIPSIIAGGATGPTHFAETLDGNKMRRHMDLTFKRPPAETYTSSQLFHIYHRITQNATPAPERETLSVHGEV